MDGGQREGKRGLIAEREENCCLQSMGTVAWCVDLKLCAKVVSFSFSLN
jgi:hypothetical protein